MVSGCLTGRWARCAANRTCCPNRRWDLFVVFHHNLQRFINDRFRFDFNQLLVKLQYAVRL
jgi:hypothetical protein